MELSFEACLKAIAVSAYPENFPALYEQMAADGSLDDPTITTAAYISEINARYSLFKQYLKEVIDAGEAIRQNPALLRYTNLLARAMQDREHFASGRVGLPASEAYDPAFAFSPVIAMLPSMAITEKNLKEHHIPQPYYDQTFASFEGCVRIVEQRFGHPGMNATYFGWLQHYFEVTIFHIHTLNFERKNAMPASCAVLKSRHTNDIVVLPYNKVMHRDGMILGSAGYTDEAGSYTAEFREDEDAYVGYPCDKLGFCMGIRVRYYKTDWELALAPGDPVLSVHIPRGTTLGGNACEEAFDQALRFYAEHYPEFKPKAFVCYSWLMDKRLDAICGGTKNISVFQSYFKTFPIPSAGKEVFSFVFIHPFDRYEDLPEDTRMMRALKKRYLDGDFVHAFGGVRLI